MTESWAVMPLVDDAHGGLDYRARPKYSVDSGVVIHHGEAAYFSFVAESDNHDLLEHSDVRALTDTEVTELEQELPYPLPSHPSKRDIDDQREQAGLGDVVAKVAHALGVDECGSCRRRRQWLNRISIGWQRKR